MSARVNLRSVDLLLLQGDRVLLDRFIASRDGDAFAALVRRHGPMVLGICQRTVRDLHLAEDAFQACFLVLARRPEAVRPEASLASWLFGVARRVSLAARRKQRRVEDLTEQSAKAPKESNPRSDFDDLLRLLDDELARLPDDLRAPLIACFLDEQTQDDAARSLGWSLSTLRRRLDRGKEVLRARLSRRGVAFGSSLFAAWLAPSVNAAVPAHLSAAVLSGSTSPGIAALAAAGLKRSLLPGTAGLAAIGFLLLGGVALAAMSSVPPVPDSQQHAPVADVPANWSRLRGRVVFPANRPLPEVRRVEAIAKDAGVIRENGPVLFEDVLVNPVDRGVQNVIVWLRPDVDDPRATFAPEQIHPDLLRSPHTMRVVEISCCQFRPRTVAARTGDTLRFVNRSTIPHTVRYESSEADDFSVLLPANSGVDAPIALASHPFAGSFACAIHPWMRGSVRVFDHPYFAVTDASGNWEIASVPRGPFRLVYWHETAGFRGDRKGEVVTVGGEAIPDAEFDVTLR